MKKIVLLVVIIMIGLLFFTISNSSNSDKFVPLVKKKNNHSLVIKRSLFVPYWTLNVLDTSFDKYIYFGIEANREGINRNDQGFKNIALFSEKISNKEKVLTLRLLNTKDNLEIVKNKELQAHIIDETLNIARENGFSGVLLDLEISALPFNTLINRINNFSQFFYKKAHENNFSYAVAIYGDNYYRVRPFEPRDLAKYADEVYVMSYDLFKAGGDPGPTFPFEGLELFGYDFKTMIDDFSRDVPKEKLNIIYGLFGYDWVVNEKGESMEIGKPRTYLDVKKNFIDKCVFSRCTIEHEKKSHAIKITYFENDQKHLIWIEDFSFINSKNSYLITKGINKISFWANSYF